MLGSAVRPSDRTEESLQQSSCAKDAGSFSILAALDLLAAFHFSDDSILLTHLLYLLAFPGSTCSGLCCIYSRLLDFGFIVHV